MIAEAQITLETVEDGVGITGETIRYASSDDGNNAPATGWVATMPDASQGAYIWTRTIFTYSDGSESAPVYSVAYQGTDGSGGSGGESAEPAIIKSIEEWSAGTDQAAGSTWATEMPRLTGSQVLWKRLRHVWNDGRADTYTPSSSGQKSTMINELVTFRNTVGSVDGNGNYTMIDGGTIKAASIDADQLKTGSITSDKIKAEAITAEKLSVSSLQASQITVGGAIMFSAVDAFASVSSKGKEIKAKTKKETWVTTASGLRKKTVLYTDTDFSVLVPCYKTYEDGTKDKRWYPVAVTSISTTNKSIKMISFSLEKKSAGYAGVRVKGERGTNSATIRAVVLFARIKE